MKKLLLSVAVFGFLVSCTKENSSMSLSRDIELDMPVLTGIVSDGILVFDSEYDLSQTVDALNNNDSYSLALVPATKADNAEDFVSLRQSLIEKGLRQFSDEELRIIKQEGLEYEPIDSLITDPYLASVLNADREIIIKNKVFKFVEKGVLQTAFDKREILKGFDKLELPDDITEGETVYVAPDVKLTVIEYKKLVEVNTDVIIQGNESGLVIAFSEEDDSFTIGGGDSLPLVCVPEVRYKDGNLTLANDVVIKNDNIRKIKYDMKESDAGFLGNLWSSIWGTNVVAYNNFSDRERMALSMFSQDYVIYRSVGMKIRMQKRTLGIWWVKPASELRYGWTAMECEYEFNNNPFANIPEFLYGLQRPKLPSNMSKKFPFSDDKIVLWNVPIIDYDLTTGDMNNLLNAALNESLDLIERWVKKNPEDADKKRGIFAVPDDLSKMYVVFPQGEETLYNTGKQKVEWDARWLDGTYTFGFSFTNGTFGSVSGSLKSNTKVNISRGTVYGAVNYNGQWKACIITTE